MLSLLTGGEVLALSDDNRPDYQKEYDAYLRDLAVIAETGRAPENPDLEADLQKMSSNDKILLNVKKKVSNSLIFAQNIPESRARIVDSVEIIRVPEEFRSQYDDSAAEKNKLLSTQDVADAQRNVQRDFIEGVTTKAVAKHENPFRLLKEVEMSDVEKKTSNVGAKVKDDLTAAYFGGNSLYVTKPAAMNDEAKDTQQKGSNTLQENEENGTASETNENEAVVEPQSHFYFFSGDRRDRSTLNAKNSMFIE